MRRGPLRVGFRAMEEGTDGPVSRVAYAIPRIVGPAVVRNRIRRRLRAIVVDLDRRPQGVPAGDYLIRVMPGAADVDFAAMHRLTTEIVDELGGTR